MHAKKIIITGMIATLLCGVIAWCVSAESVQLTEQQQEQIKTECVTIKSTLRQLHSNDALVRVNTGQLYETIATKLIERFNERANSNNMDDDALVASAKNFNSSLDNFRNDYMAYEQHLSTAMSIDCKVQPVVFYDAVSQAKTGREKVHNDIKLLNQALDSYSQTVAEFEDNNSKRIKELDQ